MILGVASKIMNMNDTRHIALSLVLTTVFIARAASASQGPVMEFTPGEGSVVLAGSNTTFTATGREAVSGIPIDPESMFWSKDGLEWPKRGSLITVNPDDWGGVGWHQARVDALDSSENWGYASHNIYYGYANPVITSPVQGTTFAVGTPITFTGTPGEFRGIVPEWWLDRGTNGPAWWPRGTNAAVRMGTGASVSYQVPHGAHNTPM